MKHLLWCVTIIIVAILALGPMWVEEYDLHNLRNSESGPIIINPEDGSPHATPWMHSPDEDKDGSWM